MKHFLFLIVTAVVCLPAMGQSITLQAGADLYERPDTGSVVKMALPPGLELSVLSEQGEWLAVSTSTGIVGWIQKSTESGEETGDLDDLLRSIDEANADAPAEPAPSPEPSNTLGSAPADTPSPPPAPNVAAPSPAPSSGTPPPPPPPSARPPGEGISFGESASSGPTFTDVVGGFYDKYQWISAAIDLKDKYKQFKLDYTKMFGGFGKIGAWLSAIDGGGYPAIDPEDFGDFGNVFSKGTTTSTCVCDLDITTVTGGIALGAFPVQPTASSPFGADINVRLGGGTFSGDDAQSGVSKAVLSGELGLFYKIGSANSPQFMPRASIQLLRDELICTGDAKDEFACGIDSSGDAKSNIGATTKNIFLSLEMNYHGLVPGVHLTLLESPDKDKTFDTLFGFSFTYAY